jgi:hypothetical protein
MGTTLELAREFAGHGDFWAETFFDGLGDTYPSELVLFLLLLIDLRFAMQQGWSLFPFLRSSQFVAASYPKISDGACFNRPWKASSRSRFMIHTQL